MQSRSLGNAKQTASQWYSHIDHRDFADWAEAQLDPGHRPLGQKHRHTLDATDEVLVSAVREFTNPAVGEERRGEGRGLKQRDGHVWLTPRFMKEKFPTLGLSEQSIRKRLRWLVEIGLLHEFHVPHGPCDGSRFRKGESGGQRSFYALGRMVVEKQRWREEYQLLAEQLGEAAVAGGSAALTAHAETKPRFPGEVALERWRVARDVFLQRLRESHVSEAKERAFVREWLEKHPKPRIPSAIEHAVLWHAACEGEVVEGLSAESVGEQEPKAQGDSLTVSEYHLGKGIEKIEKLDREVDLLVDNFSSQTVLLYPPKRYYNTTPNGIIIPPILLLDHTCSRINTSSSAEELVENSATAPPLPSTAPAAAARAGRPPAAGASESSPKKDAAWFETRRAKLREQAELLARLGGDGEGGLWASSVENRHE